MMPHDVTQADREAAAPIMRHLYCKGDTLADETFMRDVGDGVHDTHYLVQAFAAHRLAAIAADRRGRTFSPTEIDKAIAEERARVVAWLRDSAPRSGVWVHQDHFDDLAQSIERGDHIQEK